ncbi:MAG: hypothetical protein WBR26_00670 [Candidatus Acidiferrum sp.]
MATQELELFVHTQGAKPKLVTAGHGEVLRDVLLRSGVIGPEQGEVLIFVGECEEALSEPEEIEEGIDQHAPVEAGLTLEALELSRHRHIHCHRCRHIAVEVNFSGKTKRHKFSPATTIAVVTQWARKKFHLDPAAAAEYVLQICNSTDQPRSDVHLGELVQAPKCSICFDLVKEITPQG